MLPRRILYQWIACYQKLSVLREIDQKDFPENGNFLECGITDLLK
jgi:hypothetical protein